MFPACCVLNIMMIFVLLVWQATIFCRMGLALLCMILFLSTVHLLHFQGSTPSARFANQAMHFLLATAVCHTRQASATSRTAMCAKLLAITQLSVPLASLACTLPVMGSVYHTNAPIFSIAYSASLVTLHCVHNALLLTWQQPMVLCVCLCNTGALLPTVCIASSQQTNAVSACLATSSCQAHIQLLFALHRKLVGCH